MKQGPPIIHGKNPTDLPNYELAKYETGFESIISSYSGPHGGLTTVTRIEKHLSIPDADDFDFIDTQDENGKYLELKAQNNYCMFVTSREKFAIQFKDFIYDSFLITVKLVSKYYFQISKIK